MYWTKAERPGIWVQLKMGLRMTACLSLKEGLLLKKSQDHWMPTEKRYQKRKNFVEVFLLAVRKEYQGQGFFRSMLEEPFELARRRGTICVLDTDARTKADKYLHVGMRVVDHRLQCGGITMFAMEMEPDHDGKTSGCPQKRRSAYESET